MPLKIAGLLVFVLNENGFKPSFDWVDIAIHPKIIEFMSCHQTRAEHDQNGPIGYIRVGSTTDSFFCKRKSTIQIRPAS